MPIDLDAAAAARREGKDGGIEITFKGETFSLPPEMPYEMVRKLTALPEDQATESMLNSLFGDEQWAKFLELGPTLEDIRELFNGINKEYGIETGESQAS
jgi:hypothetical protein